MTLRLLEMSIGYEIQSLDKSQLTIKKSPTGREGNTKVPSSPDRTQHRGETDSEWVKLDGMSFLQSEISWKKTKQLSEYEKHYKIIKIISQTSVVNTEFTLLSFRNFQFILKSLTSFLNCFENRIKLTPLIASPSL